MGNLPPFPTLSPEAITTMVMTEAGISIVGLSVSLLALGYDHVMCVQLSVATYAVMHDAPIE